MTDWLAVGSARVFIGCCALVCLEMAALAFATPLLRVKRNVWRNEEDAQRFSGTLTDVEHRDVARLIRMHRNQLENFVVFFALGLIWIASGRNRPLSAALFSIFAIARTAHLVFFLTRMGRLRTASHTLSFIVLVILIGGAALQAIASH